jgi:hypothetical protein
VKTLAYIVIVFVFAGLVLLVLWILAIRPRQDVKVKVAGLLQLVAAYTLILGLLSGAGVFEAFDELQRELTSPDPLVFLAANFHAFSIIFGAMAVALDPNTASSTPRFFLGLPVLLFQALLLLAYAFVHFIAIVPIAYFGYLVTSVPIDAIMNSGSDIGFTRGADMIRIKQLVSQNETAIRNFAVALPAFVTSFVLKIGPLFLRRRHVPK